MSIADETSGIAAPLRSKPVHTGFSKLREDMRRHSVLKAKSVRAKVVTLQDFEIKLQIGQGSFGKVYLAELQNTSQKFAIKVIRKDKLI